MDQELLHILESEGAIDIRKYRRLRQRVARAVRDGLLVRLLPGIYGPGVAARHRIAALRQWDPNACLTGPTAAKLSWWATLPDGDVHAATRRNPSRVGSGYALSLQQIHPELVQPVDGLYCVTPAASAIQLAGELGGEAIDEALRRRAATLAQMWDALRLMPGRPGNVAIARLLEDSRDEPWSEAERDAHRRLRRAGIDGWTTNHAVRLEGATVFLDIAWRDCRLAAEIDGWQFHRTHERFVADRERDVQLALRGWTVLRFAAAHMDAFISSIQRMLEMLRRDGLRSRSLPPWGHAVACESVSQSVTRIA